MKNILFLTATFCLSLIANAAELKKWVVCTSLNNKTLDCWIEYGEENPCDVYDFWTTDQNGNLVKLDCNGVEATGASGYPHNYTNNEFSVYPQSTRGLVGLVCYNTGMATTLFDATTITANWTPLAVKVEKDSLSDTLSVKFYERKINSPFYEMPNVFVYKTTLTAISNTCNESGQRQINNIPDNIYRTVKINCQVYPNPTDDKLNIVVNSKNKNMKGMVAIIRSVSTGQNLIEVPISVGENSVSLKNLQKGVYVLVLRHNEEQVYIEKVFKK